MTNITDFRNSPLLQLEYSLLTGRSIQNLEKRSVGLHGNTNFYSFISRSKSNSSPIGLMTAGNYTDIYISVLRHAANEIAKLEIEVDLTFAEILIFINKKHNITKLQKIFDNTLSEQWATASKGELKALLVEFEWWCGCLNDLDLSLCFESAKDIINFLNEPLFKQFNRLSEIVEVSKENWALDKCVFDNILNKLDGHSDEYISQWLCQTGHVGHFNVFTNREYKTLYSWIFLDFVTIAYGYKTNLWATKKQWEKKNFTLKKNAKVAPVFHYFKVYEHDGNTGGEKILVNDFGRKVSLVYNADEVIDFGGKTYAESKVTSVDIIDQRITALNVDIREGHIAAFYPIDDYIEMPSKGAFIKDDSTQDYYATLLHEFVHWSGHESRLNRKFGDKFKDPNYAFEELVAEIGSSFLCSRFGLTKQVRVSSLTYLNSWLRALDNTQKIKLLSNAATLANRASNYIYLPKRDDDVVSVYSVDLFARVNVEIFYEFSDEEIQDTETIEEAFDQFIGQVNSDLSHEDFTASLKGHPRRNKKNTYILEGHFTKSFEFNEECINGGELFDGSCDDELAEMQEYLLALFEDNGYEATIIDFIWEDEEVLD